MANGYTHATASMVGAVIALPLGFAIFGPQGIFLTIGFLSGVIITPDLDISNPIHADNVVEGLGNKAGCCFGQLFRGIWRIFWIPYSSIIPHHRHWTSHAPLLGTVGRVIYIGLLTIGFCTLAPSIITTWEFYLWMIGLMGSDILHYMMDK